MTIKVGSLVIYNDGRLLHTAKVISIKDGTALISIFRTAQRDVQKRVSLESLSPVHEQENPA